MGFTSFSMAVRIFAKTNIMDVADDMFYIYDNRQELFITQEARCVGAFKDFLEEYFTQFEAKHGRLTTTVMIQVLCLNAIIRDSKGDAVINACHKNFQHTEKYQLEGMDWRKMKPVVGGQRKKAVAMVAAEDNQLVLFAKKQEAGAALCKHCGFSHTGPCTKKANEQAKLDRAAPFMQQIMNGKTEKQKRESLTGLFQMVGAKCRARPRWCRWRIQAECQTGSSFGSSGRSGQG